VTVNDSVFGSESATNTDLAYGLGLRYDLNRNLAFRGEWQRYSHVGDSATIGEDDIDAFSLAALWKF
jgi:opacity protein-like surface antigen